MSFRASYAAMTPSWMRGDEGERVLWTLSLMADVYAERAKQSAECRLPEYAPDDALAYLSRDRKIIRGIEESSASFARRLLRWLDDHKTRGNPYALMEQLKAYFGTVLRIRTVDTRGNWYTLEGDGTRSVAIDQGNFDWDGDAASWARFWVIVYPTADNKPWGEQGNWGDGKSWGERDSLGTTATQGEIDGMLRIIRTWKPAGTRCDWVIVAFDAASFDPSGADVPGGEWLNWHLSTAGAAEPVRLSTARYMKGPR